MKKLYKELLGRLEHLKTLDQTEKYNQGRYDECQLAILRIQQLLLDDLSTVEAEINIQSDDLVIINWSKKNVGFGQLTFKHDGGGGIKVDAECMGINHIIEVIKAL